MRDIYEKYFPPITIYEQMVDIQRDIDEKIENCIYEAVLNVGVDVDKEELLKALKYDREQYAKGYFAGRQALNTSHLEYSLCSDDNSTEIFFAKDREAAEKCLKYYQESLPHRHFYIKRRLVSDWERCEDEDCS